MEAEVRGQIEEILANARSELVGFADGGCWKWDAVG